MKFLSAQGLVLGGVLLSFALPSHAVELKQKWQAGQKLNYALDLDGTANVQMPPGAPGMAFLAGVPLEVQMDGLGTAQLSTIAVDALGTGTVAVTMPKMQVNAQTLGQKIQWTLTEGKSQLAFNGKAFNMGNQPQGDGKPKAAVKIAANGQVKGIEQLDDTGKPVVAPAAAKPADGADQAGLMGAMILKAFPALWPNADVKTGDKWQANVDFGPLARPAKDGAEAKPLGSFDLMLEGEEVVEGKTLQRVSIKGDIDLDGKTLEKAFPATATVGQGQGRPANAPAIPKLDHANQAVEGKLWFDAQAGQIAKAELVLGGRAQATSRTGNNAAGTQSWFDFTGTLNLALKSK